MIQLTEKQMLTINGGWSLSAALLGAGYKALNAIVGIGQTLGSAIRRIVTGCYCS